MNRQSRTTGADLVWSTLRQLGLRTVFGLPGTQTVPLYESLKQSGLRTVLSSSELAAAFAANGYYRASGRPAAVVTIPGPGVTMTTTGLLEALHDSTALLHLTVKKAGESPKFDLQRIDMWSFAATTAKRLVSIESPDQIVERLTEAWSLAIGGQPGPVIVEIDLPVLSGMAEPAAPEPHALSSVDDAQLQTIASRLTKSCRPILFCGQGCNSSGEDMRRLAGMTGAVILTTCSGRGVVSDDYARLINVDFANSAWTDAQRFLDEADLILALGCKLSHNGTAGFRLRLPEEKLVHIDASADVLSTNYPASLAICADLKVMLPRLLDTLRGADLGSDWSDQDLVAARSSVATRTRQALQHYPQMVGLRPESLPDFFDALRNRTDDQAVVVTDSGLHQIATRAYWSVRSARGLIVPSDFQSMGFGIPAAVGAAVAEPSRKVIAIVGDGGLSMTGTEMGTAVREHLDLTVVVFSDGYLGQIRLQQLSDAGDDHAVTLPPLNLESWAAAQQMSYARLEGDLTGALKAALELPGPRLIELPLADSPRLDRIRKIQSAKREARRLLGNRTTGWLKRLFGKS